MAESILLPAPPARVHMVGIGGVGVSGIARMLAGQGYVVSGSDIADSLIVAALISEGIPVTIGHAAENVGNADLLIVTAAARDDNPEVREARRRGITVVKRAAALGMLANPKRCLAVAGSHGKSTTSGMASFALERAGLRPSFAVGATVTGLGTNASLGDGPHFVVEADEYDHSFLWLRPAVAIVTNIEHDHPDIFPDFEAVLTAFERFAGGIHGGGVLITSAEDAGTVTLVERLGGRQRIVTCGWTRGDWQITEREHDRAIVRDPSGREFELRLSVPGRHNVSNAMMVLAAVDALGIDPASIVEHLNEFKGVGRRFEVLLDNSERTVIDDYAHHPTEVAAMIAATRERYPERRLLVVFQPHTYSRTSLLLAEFAEALNGADEVVLAEIYPSRETNDLGIYSSDIARLMSTQVTLSRSPEETADLCERRALPGDVILVMGAGTIYQTAHALAETRA